MQVLFTNPRTGESRYVKVGWSWILFLFSSFLGIPLFLRGLNWQGALFLVLWTINLLIGFDQDDDPSSVGTTIIFQLVFLGLLIWMGVKGNEYTAKRLLDTGWLFAEPDSELTKFAKMRWGFHPVGVGPAAQQAQEPAPNQNQT